MSLQLSWKLLLGAAASLSLLGDLSAAYYICTPTQTLLMAKGDSANIASQAIYSEEVAIMHAQHGWLKIITLIDGCEGWVPSESVCEGEWDELPDALFVRTGRLMAHVYSSMDTQSLPLMTVPFGCRFRVLDQPGDEANRWVMVELVDGNEAYIQRGDLQFDLSPLPVDKIANFSKRFMGLPYTYMGRSSFGYDSAGFIQMLHAQMGVFLPRSVQKQFDSHLLAPIDLESASVGDLVFFGHSPDQIHHVGIYVGDGAFIHAGTSQLKPYIRQSLLSDPQWNGSGIYGYREARTPAK